jgi:tetratricopeptide (TPR) repeat protein
MKKLTILCIDKITHHKYNYNPKMDAKKKITKKSKSDSFELDFFEKLYQENPEFYHAIFALGNAYIENGLYLEAQKLYKKLTKLFSNDAIGFYNLACAYSLLNKKILALDSLQKAVKLGYDDYKHIEKDPDLANLKRNKRFLQLLARLKNQPH